jgi:ABC-type glycerol-3-phosphate transport system permease component
MKNIFPEYEHKTQPVLPMSQFLRRLVNSGAVSLGIVAFSLFLGMAGYRYFEGFTWIDSFLNSAMLLGGMGPVNPPVTIAGKLFAGLYSLYCGLVVILVAGIILSPVAHRFLHKFHLEARNK